MPLEKSDAVLLFILRTVATGNLGDHPVMYKIWGNWSDSRGFVLMLVKFASKVWERARFVLQPFRLRAKGDLSRRPAWLTLIRWWPIE